MKKNIKDITWRRVVLLIVGMGKPWRTKQWETRKTIEELRVKWTTGRSKNKDKFYFAGCEENWRVRDVKLERLLFWNTKVPLVLKGYLKKIPINLTHFALIVFKLFLNFIYTIYFLFWSIINIHFFFLKISHLFLM